MTFHRHCHRRSPCVTHSSTIVPTTIAPSKILLSPSSAPSPATTIIHNVITVNTAIDQSCLCSWKPHVAPKPRTTALLTIGLIWVALHCSRGGTDAEVLLRMQNSHVLVGPLRILRESPLQFACAQQCEHNPPGTAGLRSPHGEGEDLQGAEEFPGAEELQGAEELHGARGALRLAHVL